MTLSILAIIIGVVFSIPQLFGLVNPKGFALHARKFHRNETAGFILMGLGTLWFLNNLNNEAIADFASYKKLMLIGFGAIGVLTCIYVRDFLAVRGFAVCLLLSAWATLNHTRWAETEWRLVLVVWAYLWIIVGMWFTVSPWRMRDYLTWLTANEQRIRISSAVRLCLGIFIVLLGLTAFRR
jgi:hypothetical protein